VTRTLSQSSVDVGMKGMKLASVRISVRWMMVTVAFFALASYSWREYQAWLRRNDFLDPVSNSQLNARLADTKPIYFFVPAKTTSITITYDFKLKKPEPGVSCLVLGMVWLEEISTKLPVDVYTFDAKLTGGEKEACSGTITWDAVVPRPGQYLLRYLRFQQPDGGDMKGKNGGSTLYEFIEERKP
jgi:hypothetical protein